ncbi:MAG TPA: SRPBCC family protein [Candidatus Methylomirabilis sp.]|nr:SRPBCC family protein [Candidatus Methylomirabilis sp.]
MGNPSFAARRTTRTYRQTINATPEKVFPLLCPVREAEWLDGWQYDMISSESGLIEEGAVFSTPHAGEADTMWIVTKHDPGKREVEFVRFTHASRICVLRIAVSAKAENTSFVDISYTYTATAPEGNAFIESLTEAIFVEAMRVWEKSLNYFLATGKKLTKAQPQSE